jgi:hypothetical protein
MNKVLLVLIAMLIVGFNVTTEAKTKKRTRAPKATTTTVSTVEKGAFAGFWEDPWDYRPILLDIRYDEENDSYWAEAGEQIIVCELTGKVKGNTLYLTGSKGRKAICTLKGDKMHMKAVRIYYGKTINTVMEQR